TAFGRRLKACSARPRSCPDTLSRPRDIIPCRNLERVSPLRLVLFAAAVAQDQPNLEQIRTKKRRYDSQIRLRQLESKVFIRLPCLKIELKWLPRISHCKRRR